MQGQIAKDGANLEHGLANHQSVLCPPPHPGRCELNVPTSGTRDRRLRGCLVSFARCPRVETDLWLPPFLSFIFGFRSIDFIVSCPVQSCPVLSCPVLSCPVLSCPVLSDHPHDIATRHCHTTFPHDFSTRPPQRWYLLRGQGLDGAGSARRASKAMPKHKKKRKYK